MKWISVVDEMPPLDTIVETRGGNEDAEEVVMDYFHSSIGDWMRNEGDPTHWRLPKQSNTPVE